MPPPATMIKVRKMLAFLSVAFLIYGGMHLYAISKIWMAFPHSVALLIVLALAGLILTFSPLIVWFLGKQNLHGAATAAAWVAYTWMGFLFLFCCTALIFDLGHIVATLMGFKWRIGELMALLGIAMPALALLGYGFLEAGQIRVERVTITTPKLISGRVTIAQISDLHLGAMLGGTFLDRIISLLRESRPDIIVATGDILDGQGDNLDELARHFLVLKPPGGAYAIIGNHEYFAGLETSLRFLRDAGFVVLRGESAATRGIILAGVDDPTAGAQTREPGSDTRKALIAASQHEFIVLLKHQPIVDNDIPFDLQLSGHIHGGQIFPFNYLTRLTYRVSTGLTRLANGRLLYVSRGAGTWGPPIRLFAPPEITLITIESRGRPQ